MQQWVVCGRDARGHGRQDARRHFSSFGRAAGISKSLKVARATVAGSRRTELLIIITPYDELSKGKFGGTAESGKAETGE